MYSLQSQWISDFINRIITVSLPIKNITFILRNQFSEFSPFWLWKCLWPINSRQFLMFCCQIKMIRTCKMHFRSHFKCFEYTLLVQSTYAKMAFILGVRSKISDTCRPIWMKLWERLEFILKPCSVIFSTSGLELKTGNWNSPENSTIIPCNIFLRFLIFPKPKHFQNDSQSFRRPKGWIKTPKFATNRPCGRLAVFLLTPKMNAI